MPPEVDPDYWFTEDTKDMNVGLSELFASTGVDGMNTLPENFLFFAQ